MSSVRGAMADAKSSIGKSRGTCGVRAMHARERTIADASNSSGDFWQAVYGGEYE